MGLGLITMLAGWIPLMFSKNIIQMSGWIMASILIIRGVYPYLIDRLLPQEPQFRRLNRWFYSPIIIFLGLGTIRLLIV